MPVVDLAAHGQRRAAARPPTAAAIAARQAQGARELIAFAKQGQIGDDRLAILHRTGRGNRCVMNLEPKAAAV